MSINKVILIGNLGNEPEAKTFTNGDKITTVSIATSERWTDKNTGEKKEQTEWHRVVFSNRLADVAEQYLHKGSKVYIEGKIKTRKWQDQNGHERYSTEIRADNMQMLDSRNDGNQPNYNQGGQRSAPNTSYQSSGTPAYNQPSVSDDDMPF